MLLHESCHFYGLQWLICLFKFSIKPGGTGRIRKRRAVQCCLGFASALGRYSHTWSQVIRLFCRQLTQSGAGVWWTSQRFISNSTEKKKCKWKYFVTSHPTPSLSDKSLCLFLSFVQVALSRVMPLKCQLSVWACIALDKVQFTTHKNSSQSHCYTERNKIWSLHFPFPWRPYALIICQSDRCFSNDGVSCVLNFYQSSTVRDCGTLYTIWWWKPPRTDSLCCEAFCRQV